MDLDGRNAFTLHLLGIDGIVDIRFHDADPILLFQLADGAEQDRCLSGARGCHDVDQKGLISLILPADFVRNPVVFIKDARMDIDYTNLAHDCSAPSFCACI